MMNFQKAPILIVGDEMETFSVVVCLLQAQHPVTLLTSNKTEALKAIDKHFSAFASGLTTVLNREDFEIHSSSETEVKAEVAVLITSEDLLIKRAAIALAERLLPERALIAVNTESIPLGEIQEDAVNAARIIGANWVEPVHTTFFLEVISNEGTPGDLLDAFVSTARANWQKDPYVLRNGAGIRSRMMSAMAREAFFLLENGYVSIEDIDRACRNDPGYYLPFAGHCRYMDLMGAYVYGLVMKDLNPELSKETSVPEFFTRIVQAGGEGFKNGKGFYTYAPEEVEKRMEEFRRFSVEMRDIISKYPFNDLKEILPAKRKAVSKL